MTELHAERRPVVVVGYDGSDASRAAVAHAIHRTGPDGRLVVVHSYQVPADYVGAVYYNAMYEDAADGANRTVDALEEAEPLLTTVDWERRVSLGDPAEVLCRTAAAEDADEIVLGTRGVGRLRGIIGSVAHDVLHHADRPVLVIPDRMVQRAVAQAAETSITAAPSSRPERRSSSAEPARSSG